MPHDDRKSVPALLTLTEMADAVKATNADQYPKKIVATPWVRPSDWPALPIPSGAYAAGLYGINDTGSNFVALAASDDYTVDWGDGSALEDFTAGTQANHYFDYSAPGLGPLVSDGFKTAIIVVTPQDGNFLTSFDITVNNPDAVSQYYVSTWLDVAVNGPDLTSLLINGDGNANLTSLTQIQLYDSGHITDFSAMFTFNISMKSAIFGKTSSITLARALFSYCFSLEYVSLFDTSNVTDFNHMFYNCYSLRIVPSFDVSSALDFSYMFYGCFSLQSIPEFNSSSVTNFDYMLAYCYILKSVPLFDTSSGTSFVHMFDNCNVLETIPQFNTISATTTNAMFLNCMSLSTVPLLDTSSVTDFQFMFDQCFSLITIAKLNTSQGTNFAAIFASAPSISKATFIGTTLSIDYSGLYLPVDELISILDNLGTASGSPGDQTIVIVNNWGNDGSAPLLAAIDSAIAKGWAVGS